jgi:hypothetical protein
MRIILPTSPTDPGCSSPSFAPLNLEQFLRYILVPHAALLLISTDSESEHNPMLSEAYDIMVASADYGDLVNDNEGEILDDIHIENMKAAKKEAARLKQGRTQKVSQTMYVLMVYDRHTNAVDSDTQESSGGPHERPKPKPVSGRSEAVVVCRSTNHFLNSLGVRARSMCHHRRRHS